MLILILIDVQYSKKAAFSFEKGSNCQNHFSAGSLDPVKNPCSKISWRRRRYVSNKTPNDFSVESRQDVSVVRLHDVLLKHRNNVLRGRNNDIPSAGLHDVSNKYQVKHPTTSQWYVTKTSQLHVSTTCHYYVSTTSPLSHK